MPPKKITYTRQKGRRQRITRALHKNFTPSVYRFKQTYKAPTIVANPSGGSLNQPYAPTMASLTQIAAFQEIFDVYRIKKIVFHFEPNFTSNDVNGASGTPNIANPMVGRYIRVVKDYDDANALSGENDYFEYSNMKSYEFFRKRFNVTLYPKIKTDMNGVNDLSVSPTWIDFDNINVPHYGIKVFFPQTNMPLSYELYNLLITIHFECKNVR